MEIAGTSIRFLIPVPNLIVRVFPRRKILLLAGEIITWNAKYRVVFRKKSFPRSTTNNFLRHGGRKKRNNAYLYKSSFSKARFEEKELRFFKGEGGVRTGHKPFLVSPRARRREKEEKKGKRREAKWRPLLWVSGRLPPRSGKWRRENIFHLEPRGCGRRRLASSVRVEHSNNVEQRYVRTRYTIGIVRRLVWISREYPRNRALYAALFPSLSYKFESYLFDE